jgi:hypothetical protein
VVLRRLAPAEEAGLERLFLDLTASGARDSSTRAELTDPELAGAAA